MSNTFSNKLKDSLSNIQIKQMYSLAKLTESLFKEQTNEERKKTQEEIKKLIIKPESSEQKAGEISKLVATEVEHIALPGYDYLENQKQESQIGRGLNKAAITPESIAKQEVIQNILLNHYELEESQIIVLTERIKQEHLNHKYFAYYAGIKETGILIVLNDQYGQAARIKKVESIEDAETQLASLIAMLENIDKKTMDQILGFEAFDNTYISIEDLQELYIRKINEHLINTSPVINLTGSAEQIWQQVKGQTIRYSNSEYRVNTIQDFIELAFTVIALGKIGSTPAREIFNRILSLEGDKKITCYTNGPRVEENKLNVENARNLLKDKALAGEFEEEAKVEYEAYLNLNTEKVEDIWKGINLPTTMIFRKKEYPINTIQDFLKLPFSAIALGKIGSTPVREIINSLLGLEGEEKITWHTSGKKIKKEADTNKERVENVRNLLKDKVLAGEFGEDEQKKYENYLKEEIILTGNAEDIWQQIKGKKITCINKEIKTLQDLIGLTYKVIIYKKIGSTPVREIINALLGLEGEEKITFHNHRPKREANKLNVENAKELLKKKVLEGSFGEKAQEEYKKTLEEEIDLNGTAQYIWERIKGNYIKGKGLQYKKIETIQDLLELSFTGIIKGEIGSTPVREIINVLLELEEDEKITSHQGKEKGKANKLKVEKVRRLLKQKVIEGGLGEEAQEEYQKKLEEEIDLNGSTEEIWEKIQGKTITSHNRKYRVNTIQDFIGLSFTIIVKGKIEKTPMRNIINSLLGLKEDEKITFHDHVPKAESNKLRVENARRLLKDKALAGDFGEEAQREMQTIIETENIQAQIREEIEEI